VASKTHSGAKKITRDGMQAVPVEKLYSIVAGFHPEEIGLSKAWDELYYACQAAAASPQLLQAIHDIKESIEDMEAEQQ
jgi:hypothetical protein